MSNVVPFAKPPQAEEDEATVWGDARCHALDCGHKWSAVAPVGTVVLECPKCGDFAGYWCGEFSPPEGSLVRECECGEQLFYLTPEGHMCRRCGTYQTY